ncbi:MAG: DEAD/DEAH box helicase, partial [Gemmatimonadetes bacterium]|nr:DEAD/DEAH box helicase [Gemmatimonadota bacterium]NIR80876.1 DEAD/DEAH box helicase [Gemmatimonadota bacterium]NIT89695.1 DEAD/DEAH box helicase [Gemmatimonadota bacterium]NIU33479.1 DEAD/DEAH box helicase [Gemmatimonadota bacterium]NIU37761.1 DEAD/DEAH box helicase [Gemmatimonadota bacterium]
MSGAPPPHPRRVLTEVFGYDAFRPGQETVIRAVLAGHDCIGVMPTGAGKSLTYQLPARILPGTVLVLSPLISLMKDQVDALRELGFRATAINST